MKYLVYGRVSPKGSTWSGSETSIPDQVLECQSFVLARDPGAEFEIVTDEFQSAGSTRRPGYQRILGDLAGGTADWDVLVVRHIDRLNRSLTDAIKILQLLQANGKGLISTTQQLDMSTPTGRAMLHIILIFAQWEREMGSERTKMKMKSIAASGGWPPGVCPVGYKRPGKGENGLVPDPRQAEMVVGVFEDYVSGVPPVDIIDKYGLKSRQRLYHILRNKVYCGLIEYDGELYKGRHDPLIGADVWHRVQAAIGPKKAGTRPKAWRHDYILSGLVRCTCGRYMTPASADGRAKRYYYYQCTDHVGCKKRIAAAEIEDFVLENLKSIEMEPGDVEEMKTMAREFFHAACPTLAEVDRVREALRDARKERDRVKRLFLDGIVTHDNAAMFNDDLARANDEVNRLQGRLDALLVITNKDTAELFKVDTVLDQLENLRDGLLAADDCQAQRLIVNGFVETITCVEGGGYDIELKLDGSSKSQGWLAERDLYEPRVVLRVTETGARWRIA